MKLVREAKQFFGRMGKGATFETGLPAEPGAPTGVAREAAVRTVLTEPLQTAQLTDAFAGMLGTAPTSSLATPSMMSIAERQFLFGLASRYYAGKGIIIDAGIFLGASTRCFGEGLRANVRYEELRQAWKQPVVSFERAIVNPNMPDFFKRHGMAFTAERGESFEAELRRNIEPVQDLVDLRVGDIMETAEVNQPVEILFLDILKDPRVSVHTVRSFYPKLIAGRSVVIQQDYFYERLPWIKTHQEIFRAHFDFVGEIGSSAVFLCTKEIPQDVVDVLAGEIPPAEQLRLASIAMQRSADPSRRFLMALSKMRLIQKLQGRAAARAYLDVVKGEFPEQVSQTRHERLSDALSEAEKYCVEKVKPPRPATKGKSSSRPAVKDTPNRDGPPSLFEF